MLFQLGLVVAARMLQTSIDGALKTGDPCADSFGYLCGGQQQTKQGGEAEQLLKGELSPPKPLKTLFIKMPSGDLRIKASSDWDT